MTASMTRCNPQSYLVISLMDETCTNNFSEEKYETDYDHIFGEQWQMYYGRCKKIGRPVTVLMDEEEISLDTAGKALDMKGNTLHLKLRDGICGVNGYRFEIPDIEAEWQAWLTKRHEEEEARREVQHQERVARMKEIWAKRKKDAPPKKVLTPEEIREKMMEGDRRYQEKHTAKKIQELKDTVEWTIRTQELKPMARVYLNGHETPRRDVCRRLKVSEAILNALLKIGDFTHDGDRIECRNLVKIERPKRVLLKTPEQKAEAKARYREQDRLRAAARRALNPKPPKPPKVVKVRNPPPNKREFTLTPYVSKPNRGNACIFIDGVRADYHKAAEIMGVGANFMREKVRLGILTYNGHTAELRASPKNLPGNHPPKIYKAGIRWVIKATVNGKLKIIYSSRDEEKVKARLDTLL